MTKVISRIFSSDEFTVYFLTFEEISFYLVCFLVTFSVVSLMHIKIRLLLPLFTAALLFLSACSDDETADPTVDDRVKFAGKWKCMEVIGSTSTSFDIYITSYGESDSIRISNFSNYGNTAVALGLVSGNSLVIPNQTISITNIPVQGTGIFTYQGGNEKLNLNYTSDGQYATAVCVR